MRVEAWAFNEDGKETSAKYTARYKEIKHLSGKLEIRKNPQYAHNTFTGTIPDDPECRALTEFDLLLIADHGNLCFGGECRRNGASFSGSYNTD